MIAQAIRSDKDLIIQTICAIAEDCPQPFYTPLDRSIMSLAEIFIQVRCKMPELQPAQRKAAFAVAEETFEICLKDYFDDQNDSALFLYRDAAGVKGMLGFVTNNKNKRVFR